ncbi:peptide/nickel transport system substrate-binding protein [Saccharothrix tamanrassetensis]|uniref:Peptide/nickel transport system substrate-binding protein n=1 Tax=Saccharothrix tamanrassetensis TaxID=1051531 RepID=A0A841CR99_9PSEU|nr:ABC transporter substrate-binding protein [Saccharothrix tamanrassetensis]MBB5959819.1 peptide/nickel transport system substrate-binding protein [Saccharothrix tamanrassetensis]
MSATPARRPSSRLLGIATGAVLIAAALAGCAPPERAGNSGGGTLRIAAATDPGESLNPYASNQSPTQQLRSALLYEGLTRLDHTGRREWRLATDMTANADFSEWTIKLRPGVKFTDGSDFTSADVVASIKYLRDPAHAVQGLAFIEKIDPKAVEAVDGLTVRVGLSEPFAPFKEIWANVLLPMTKAGSVPEKPIGTGPFSVKDFAAGRQSKLERFDGYWGDKPQLGGVDIIEFPSQQAQANALLSNQVDIASGATPTIAKSFAGKNGIALLDSKGDFTLRIGLNTTVAPFDDLRVRQALRLLIDREQVVSNAFGGYARVANDHEGGTPQCVAPDIPQRKQDIEQAKRLLAEAGQSDLSFSVTTDGLLPGMQELAQVFSENAAKAGVKVAVNVVTVPELLSKWGQWPVFIDFNPIPYLPTVIGGLLPGRVGNATHWDNPAFVGLADQLFLAPEHEQCAIMNQMHKIEHEQGTTITPAFVNVLMPHRSNVRGLVPDVNGRPLSFLTNVTVES